MLMRLYHSRYTEQIETADAATILARWELLPIGRQAAWAC
jgi:hypothetical protein